MTDRDLDVVLLGATGFTGRLIAAHLIETAPEGVRLGFAGRSRARLDALVADIGPAAARAELIEIDVRDWADLQALVAGQDAAGFAQLMRRGQAYLQDRAAARQT